MKEAIVVFFDKEQPTVIVGEMTKAEFGQYAGYEVRGACYNKNGIPYVPAGYRLRSAAVVGGKK